MLGICSTTRLINRFLFVYTYNQLWIATMNCRDCSFVTQLFALCIHLTWDLLQTIAINTQACQITNLFHLTLSSMLLLYVAVDLVHIVPISFLQWGRVSQPNLCLVILNLNAWNIMELFPRVKGIPDLAFYKRELWRPLSPDAISLVLEGNPWRGFLRHHSLNSWPRSPGLWSHSSFNMTQ